MTLTSLPRAESERATPGQCERRSLAVGSECSRRLSKQSRMVTTLGRETSARRGSGSRGAAKEPQNPENPQAQGEKCLRWREQSLGLQPLHKSQKKLQLAMCNVCFRPLPSSLFMLIHFCSQPMWSLKKKRWLSTAPSLLRRPCFIPPRQLSYDPTKFQQKSWPFHTPTCPPCISTQ